MSTTSATDGSTRLSSRRSSSPSPASHILGALGASGGRRPRRSGGAPGFARFLAAIRDPDDEEHEEYLEWVGGAFDPDEFDPEHVTEQIADERAV